ACNLGHGSNTGNTGTAEASATKPKSVSPMRIIVNGLHCATSHTHTTSLRCHPHVPTFEPCPTWGMVQMSVTLGPQNPAQRTQSVSPIRKWLMDYIAPRHTHDFSQVSPSRANFCTMTNLATFFFNWAS